MRTQLIKIINETEEVLKALPPGRLQPEKILISLKTEGGHDLQIQFGIRATDSRSIEGEGTVMLTLSQILGKPSFDSAARAEVLGEILESLTEIEVAEIVSNKMLIESRLKELRHRMQNVFRAGPIGNVEEAGKTFSKMLQHTSRSVILASLKEQWKTQHAWIS